MSDFDDLRQMHEAKERAEALKRQREQEKYRRQAEAARRLTEIRKANADKLNSMVVDVLEALRDALYPGLEVRRISSECANQVCLDGESCAQYRDWTNMDGIRTMNLSLRFMLSSINGVKQNTLLVSRFRAVARPKRNSYELV